MNLEVLQTARQPATAQALPGQQYVHFEAQISTDKESIWTSSKWLLPKAALFASAMTNSSHSTRLFLTSTKYKRTVLTVPLKRMNPAFDDIWGEDSQGKQKCKRCVVVATRIGDDSRGDEWPDECGSLSYLKVKG